MSLINFDEMPDATRLWIYASERAFSKAEQKLIKTEMTKFLELWTAHKRELNAGWQLLYEQFVMVAVDESMMSASGCSIDSLVNFLAETQTQIGCKIVGTHSLVFYKDESGRVHSVDRPAFKKLLEEEQVNSDTIVFDNTIQTVGDFKQGKWELAMKDSWHGKAFLKAA